MAHLQLQVRLRWTDTPPQCGSFIHDATSVDSALLITAAHSAHAFKDSIPVGDDEWYECAAWCNMRDVSPPSYDAQGSLRSSDHRGSCKSMVVRAEKPAEQWTLSHETQSRPLSEHEMEKVTFARGVGSYVPRADCANSFLESGDEDAEECGQICRFGRPCGVILTDVTEEGLNRHLLQYHLQDLQDSIID